MRTTSVNVIAEAILKVTWSQLYSKFLLNNYETLWQQDFERHSRVKDSKHAKTATLRPIFKKDDSIKIKNYWPDLWVF